MSASCPVSANPDDRKSARLAAERLQTEAGARLVGDFAFGRKILRSTAMRQAADIGVERFDLSDPATTPVIFLDGEAHRRKRSAIAKFFTPKAVSTQYLAVTVAAEIVGLINSDGAAISRPIATWNDALMSYELRGAVVSCDRAGPTPAA
jgi:cytochrome P450